ncbi:early estrogen-induced gene 1 protein-like [Clavelina lepadiformis]|uniref:C2 NT-type domain-containing protein n=1 Tax=Clavelina lepadiformis TaxID=159417 RepID=A0ABP0FWK4_CLALP
MSFFKPLVMTKKKFKFQISLFIDELNAVPFVTGVLYSKIRLRNGGAYVESTARENVKDNCVCWRQRFEYTCKMSADPLTGILDPCIARISVRKEVKGGRSATKIGFVDLNLAEFAGGGQTSRHCLLEGYDDKIRLDNSILKIVIGMQLLSGDPLFKVPTVYESALQLPDGRGDIQPGLDSDSSGFGSLPRATAHKKNRTVTDSFEPSHVRNPSSVSQQSKRSDYGSQHSRTPSNISQMSTSMDSITEQDSAIGSMNILKSPQKLPLTPGRMPPPPRPPPPHASTVNISQNRMGETRVSADAVVNKLMESQDFTPNTNGNDGDNLRLYVSSDGSTALGGQTFHNRVGSGVYHPVVFGSSTS